MNSIEPCDRLDSFEPFTNPVRCHIILRPHPKNRPRLSRDNKIDDISLNTHTNRFKFKPHITSMYIHICGKNQRLIML